MIVSHRHRFVFFHNPKVGGTSVRKALERFNDVGFEFWGVDTAQTGIAVDRAHLGIADFAHFYPDLWRDAQDYALFSLSRDPLLRFFSSMSEYSRHHGRIDMRFAPPAQRKAALFAMIDRLDGLGSADGVLAQYELTHFRPQHIYWRAPELSRQARVWPLEGIADFLAQIEARVGAPVQTQAVKQRELLALPWPLSGLASHRAVKRIAAALPGGGAVKDLVRRRFRAPAAGAKIHDDGYDLTATERQTVAAFVRRFYACDLDAPAVPPQTPTHGAAAAAPSG